MDVTFRHMAAAAKLVEGWGGRKVNRNTSGTSIERL